MKPYHLLSIMRSAGAVHQTSRYTGLTNALLEKLPLLIKYSLILIFVKQM
jgi:hypothetical protein